MTCLVENTRNQHQWQPVADISSYPQALRSIPLLFAFAGQGGHCGQWHKNLNVVRNPKTHGALCRSTWMAALSSSHSLRRPRTPRTPWQVHCTCFKLPSVSACTWFFGKFWLRGKVWQSRVGVAGVTSFAHVDSSNYPGPSETWTQIMNQRSPMFLCLTDSHSTLKRSAPNQKKALVLSQNSNISARNQGPPNDPNVHRAWRFWLLCFVVLSCEGT